MKHSNKIIILLIFLSFFILTNDKLFAQENKLNIPSELHIKITSFFGMIKSDEVEEAYKAILVKSQLMEDSTNIEKLITETAKIEEYYGKLNSFEYIKVENASPSYLRIKCLGLYSNHPIRWMFTFYKSPEFDWILTNIKFDDLTENYFLEK